MLLQLLLSGCGNSESSKIKDIIPNLNLEFHIEREIVISDLFFSQNYNISFSENDNVNIQHNKESISIKLRSKSDFVGMTLIKSALDGIVYSIPVTKGGKTSKFKHIFKEDKNGTTKLVFPNVYEASKLVSLIDDNEIDVVGSEASVKLSSENYNIYKM